MADSDRRAAVYAGVLFIIATVADVLGTSLSSSILAGSHYLTAVSANTNQVTGGALLEFIGAAACPGIAIALYPVLRRWHSGLALGSVVFRTIEAVMYMVGIVSLLALLVVGQKFVGSVAADRVALQAVGDSLLAVRAQANLPGVLAFSLGALMYYYVFYESRLIPRWLSGWGIAAIILTIAACVLALFGHTPLTTFTIILLPIAVQEMVLALWLIVRGFNASAPKPSLISQEEVPSPALR